MYKNFAFISYSHCDMSTARWLQKSLEGFKLPTEIHNDIEAGSRYLRPIFRDQSDLNSGILSEELRKNLEKSKFLIVICSKDSAQSLWVSNEVQAFVEMGRLDRVIPLIIPDVNSSDNKLFPIYLRHYFEQNPTKELLGVNIREIGKEKALIRIVSKMIDVSFDSLWKRHERQKRIKGITISVASLLSIVTTYVFAFPVELVVRVTPETSFLPIAKTVTMNVEGAEYYSTQDEPRFTPIKLPGYKRFSTIYISVTSQFFKQTDTTIGVGYGTNRKVTLNLKRDESFSTYEGIVYNTEMTPLEGVIVTVSTQTDTTDSCGCFSIVLPLNEQRTEHPISLSKHGYTTIYNESETPSKDIRIIMHKSHNN